VNQGTLSAVSCTTGISFGHILLVNADENQTLFGFMILISCAVARDIFRKGLTRMGFLHIQPENPINKDCILSTQTFASGSFLKCLCK